MTLGPTRDVPPAGYPYAEKQHTGKPTVTKVKEVSLLTDTQPTTFNHVPIKSSAFPNNPKFIVHVTLVKTLAMKVHLYTRDKKTCLLYGNPSIPRSLYRSLRSVRLVLPGAANPKSAAIWTDTHFRCHGPHLRKNHWTRIRDISHERRRRGWNAIAEGEGRDGMNELGGGGGDSTDRPID